MKRRLATTLAAAALFAFASAPTTTTTAQTPTPRTGELRPRTVTAGCFQHAEVPNNVAGRCPKCRAAERRLKVYREKDKNKVNQPQ